jgi:hypothetical protein
VLAPLFKHRLKIFDILRKHPEDGFRRVGREICCAPRVLPRTGGLEISNHHKTLWIRPLLVRILLTKVILITRCTPPRTFRMFNARTLF